MALESVQPVPVRVRGGDAPAAEPAALTAAPEQGRPRRSPGARPLQSTAQPYFSLMALAAAPCRRRRLSPPRRAAPPRGMLGVSTVASGSSRSLSAPTASSLISLSPGGGHHHRVHHYVPRAVLAQLVRYYLDERYAGDHARLHRVREDVREHAVELRGRNSGVDSKILFTPVVFWAVRAVMALMAYTPGAGHGLDVGLYPGASAESRPQVQCCPHFSAPFTLTAKFYIATESGAPDPPRQRA